MWVVTFDQQVYTLHLYCSHMYCWCTCVASRFFIACYDHNVSVLWNVFQGPKCTHFKQLLFNWFRKSCIHAETLLANVWHSYDQHVPFVCTHLLIMIWSVCGSCKNHLQCQHYLLRSLFPKEILQSPVAMSGLNVLWMIDVIFTQELCILTPVAESVCDTGDHIFHVRSNPFAQTPHIIRF